MIEGTALSGESTYKNVCKLLILREEVGSLERVSSCNAEPEKATLPREGGIAKIQLSKSNSGSLATAAPSGTEARTELE